MAVILSNVQDEPQSIRLATCLDRSAAASGATACTVSPRLPWRKLLSLAERLAMVEPPGVGRLIGRSGPLKGLEPFQATAWAGGDFDDSASGQRRIAHAILGLNALRRHSFDTSIGMCFF
jgi:hypothetical protein